MNFNVFRILGDVSHTTSKCVLIWAIHSNRSAEGVSLLTQLLYILVFVTRYLDLFWVPPSASLWNFVLKNFYIWSSLYIILLMTRVYARTREREKAWRFAGILLAGSVAAAPIVMIIFEGWAGFTEMLWTFSIILESVCVLPQLLLLRQTTVPTVIDSFYLVTLGSYRAFYFPNWIIRWATEGHFDPIAVIFGLIQSILYIDFAYVYWTRQRVKLRGGAIVDSDDMSKGWLVNRVLALTGGRANSIDEAEEGTARNRFRPIHSDDHDEDGQENGIIAPQPRAPHNRWGARGISIAADDTLEEHSRKTQARSNKAKGFSDDAGREDELHGILGDGDDFEDDDDGFGDAPTLLDPVAAIGKEDENGIPGVTGGEEWDDHDAGSSSRA